MSHVDLTTAPAGAAVVQARGARPCRSTAGSRERVRAWTVSSLRDVAYAAAVSAWSVVAFTVLVAGVSVTASLLVLVFGVVAWLGFAYAARSVTWVDRRLAGWQRDEQVPAHYRRPVEKGLVPLLRTVSSDPQTWRDLGWLAVTSIAGFVLGVAVLTAASIALAWTTMPVWFWVVPDPSTQHGLTDLGVFTVDTVREAVAASALGLALVPVVLLLARSGATAHAALAARVLGARRPG